MKNDSENLNTGEKINSFIQKNRKTIFIVFGVLLAAFLGMIAFFIITDRIHNNALAQADEFNRRFIELQSENNEAEINNLLAELNDFAKNKSGFPAGRAWTIIAQIYSAREDWQKAEEAWLNAANTAPKTYLAPMALFNAAVCAEEQGKIEQAIELLEQAVSHREEFPSSPRAQFSIGRLYEQTGNYSSAAEAYRVILVRWPDISVWANLAQSRIIALEIQ